jgi:hypothetical protein
MTHSNSPRNAPIRQAIRFAVPVVAARVTLLLLVLVLIINGGAG